MLIRRNGGPWEPPEISRYEDEASFQQLLAESPELLGLGGRPPAVALREVTIPDAGYLDLLLVHVDGSLTLVEVKLNRNAEIRRAVVGQLLGYAGGLVTMSFSDLDRAVQSSHGQPLVDMIAERAHGSGGDFDAAAFQQALESNLRAGRYRLVFAVDEISEDLRRAVEFLNANTVGGLEITVLELSYARVDNVEILIDRTYGEEAARRKQASRVTPSWTEEDLFAMLDSACTRDQSLAIRELYEWAKPRTTRLYFGEGSTPSVTLIFATDDGDIQPCTIYNTGVAINFEWIRKRPTELRQAFLDQLSQIPTISALRDEILATDFKKRPTLPFDQAANHVPAISEAIKTISDLGDKGS